MVELKQSISPLGESFSFACPKESNQSKRHPLPRPSASLRYSTNQAAAELAALRQSSPKTPDSSALLGMAAGDCKPANHHRHSEQSEESSFWQGVNKRSALRRMSSYPCLLRFL